MTTDNEYTQALKDDFRNFLFRVWQELGLPEPSRVQYDMGGFLQNGPDRRMIQAMRGAGKSYETAAFAAWLLYRNPDTTLLCISAVQTRAREFILLVRKIIDSMDELAHLRPGEWDRDGADRFDVGCRSRPDKNPSVAAYGIKSMVTGTHVDCVILDDVEIPENSSTVEARDKLMYKVKEFENILNPGGHIIYLGTPQTEDSVYNRLAEHYECRQWPARYPDPTNEARMKRLAPLLVEDLDKGAVKAGDPTYPEYYSDDLLVEREAIMGPTMFALQMLLDTTLSDRDRYPLKLSNLIVWDMAGNMAPTVMTWGTTNPVGIECPGLTGDRYNGPVYSSPSWAEYENTIMYIDPSGRGEDQTGYCVARLLNGTIHVPACDGLKGGYDDETMTRLAEIGHQHGVRHFVVEKNWGDGMYAKLLTPHVARVCGHASVEEKHSTGQKELRIIDILEPVMANHRLCISREVAQNMELGTQITRITRDKGALRHDDQVESLAGAVGWYKDQMVLDSVKRAETKAEETGRKAAAEFLREFKTPKPSRWVLPVTGEIVTGAAKTEWLGGKNKKWGRYR